MYAIGSEIWQIAMVVGNLASRLVRIQFFRKKDDEIKFGPFGVVVDRRCAETTWLQDSLRAADLG